MRDIECVSCEVRDGQVDIYDQDGNYINSIFEPNVENAYSNGRQVVVQSNDISVIYTVQRNGVIKRTADRFRSGSKSRKSSVDPNLVPKIENRPSGSSFSGCGTILILGCIVGLYKIFFSGGESTEQTKQQRQQSVQQQVAQSRQNEESSTSVEDLIGKLRCDRYIDGEYRVCVNGTYRLATKNGDIGNLGKAMLKLWKRNGIHEIYITFDDVIVSEKMVLMYAILDKRTKTIINAYEREKLQSIEGEPSTDYRSIFLCGDMVAVINEMRGHECFLLVCMFNGRMYIAEFPNISNAFKKYCQLENGLE